MHFDWWTFALQTVNFAILVWLLHRFLYQPVLRLIDDRRAAIDKQNEDARAVEEKARAALAALEAERASLAAGRAEALKAAAAREAEEAAAARRVQAQREAATLLDEARKTIAAERLQAAAEIRRVALDLGVHIARRLLGEVPSEMRAKAWLERIEAHLAALSPAERKELGGALNGGASLRVVTAAPLTDEAAAEWRTRINGALGGHFAIIFEADEALVAGAELHFPNAVLHSSWRNALASMREEIESHDSPR